MSTVRQVVLDTETTGLNPADDKVIEIGCVELINRRLTGNNYHQYINPLREISQGAIDVHGITNEYLADKPVFADIIYPFLDYVKGSELVIHNASFDVGFLNHEMKAFDPALGAIEDYCSVVDSLMVARELHPGQRNDLDSLAKRYDIDNSHRTLHGALLDSEILADVYLMMTGGQSALSLEELNGEDREQAENVERLDLSEFDLTVVTASEDELTAHQALVGKIDQEIGDRSLWSQLASVETSHGE